MKQFFVNINKIKNKNLVKLTKNNIKKSIKRKNLDQDQDLKENKEDQVVIIDSVIVKGLKIQNHHLKNHLFKNLKIY